MPVVPQPMGYIRPSRKLVGDDARRDIDASGLDHRGNAPVPKLPSDEDPGQRGGRHGHKRRQCQRKPLLLGGIPEARMEDPPRDSSQIESRRGIRGLLLLTEVAASTRTVREDYAE